MKLGKKLLGLVVAATLVVGTSVTAFAATVNDVTTALTNAGVASTYVAQAQTYLNSKNFTAAQLDTVKADVAIVVAKNVKTVADYNALSAADKTAVANAVKDAATTVGLTVTASGTGFVAKDSTGTAIITLADAATSDTAATGKAANTTATNYGNILAVGAALAIAGAAGTVVAAKKREVVANN